MHENVIGMLNLQWWCGEKLGWGPTEVLLPWLHRCALCLCRRPLCSRWRPKPAEVWRLLSTCWFLPRWNITDHIRNLFIDTFKKKDNFYNQEKRKEKNINMIPWFFKILLCFSQSLLKPLSFLQLLGTASRYIYCYFNKNWIWCSIDLWLMQYVR